MKVLHAIGPLDLGGAQTQLLGLISAGHGKYWDAQVIGTSGGTIAPAFEELQVPLKIYHRRMSPGLGRIVLLSRDIRTSRADVVNPHLWQTIVQSVVAGSLVRRPPPVVAVEHNLEAAPSAARRLIDRAVGHAPAAYVGVTDAMAKYSAEVHRLPLDSVPLIPYGIDRAVFRPLGPRDGGPEASPVLFGAGRLAPEKGWDVLIDAVRLLHEDHGVDVSCKIAGVGPLLDELRQRARDLPVSFIGRIEPGLPMSQFLRSANVVVLPSRYREARPVILLEAICAGTPVVATDIPGLSETIGHAGLLAPPGDASAFASAIAEILSGQPFWDTRAVRQAAHIPSFDDVARMYSSLFVDIARRAS